MAAGLVHKGGIRWLEALCERLDSIISDGPTPPHVFIHDDVKPDNVMIDKRVWSTSSTGVTQASETQPTTSSRYQCVRLS